MEEKKYPIGGYAPGNYQCKCGTCGETFHGDKRAVQCEPCALEAKARFDALDPNDKELLIKRNARIANYMFSGPLSAERDLIYRIVKEWGNAIEMPNMEQWLRDYAATRQTGAGWVKASTFDIKRNIVYHATYEDKNQIIKGSGFFNINDWFIWDNKEIEERYKDDWDKLLILDESGTPAAAREEGAEIKRRTKIIEDMLKRDMRLNMPGISEAEQERTWQDFKKTNKL